MCGRQQITSTGCVAGAALPGLLQRAYVVLCRVVLLYHELMQQDSQGMEMKALCLLQKACCKVPATCR